MARPKKIEVPAKAEAKLDSKDIRPAVSDKSSELVIGLVGYAGSGCTVVANKLKSLLEKHGYAVHRVQLSKLITERFPEKRPPEAQEGDGKAKLERTEALQNLGDELRAKFGPHAVASLAVKDIMRLRNQAEAGKGKIAFILDSIKHGAEVRLLREVYDTSFRLVAVHSERVHRQARLYGDWKSSAKYVGADQESVRRYMDRDENDPDNPHGQQVREAFYLADYFFDNNNTSTAAARLNSDVERFVHLVLGEGLIRPTNAEVCMYSAYSASLQSSCLSRQVGAALQSTDGRIIATGANEVPKFGGGEYAEGDQPDHRCFAWNWGSKEAPFIGCHNNRRKRLLENTIAEWLAEEMAARIARVIHPSDGGLGMEQAARARDEEKIKNFFRSESRSVENMPGISDLIEYSRSIHAEMSAILSAARKGVSTVGTTLFCTTYPCHNCARHLISAGVRFVYYIEPYVKSLAGELHADALQTDLPQGGRDELKKMVVVAFTGVGPRMYEDHFLKRGELKDKAGQFLPPVGATPSFAVRLDQLGAVERRAADLVPEGE